MVTLASADKALKSLYLDVVAEQLNTEINPFLAKIKQTTSDVWGKEVRKVAQYGINGGIGAGTEDGNLPTSSGNNYEQMVLTLKNLYGTIEISDKAIRASANDAGAFVNLLNAEMEGLVKSSALNMGRMLFGDGNGILTKVKGINDGEIQVLDTKNILPGMMVCFHSGSNGLALSVTKRKVLNVNRDDKTITLDGAALTTTDLPVGTFIVVQGSFQQEITGLGAIFKSTGSIYGLKRSEHSWLVPYMNTEVGEISETEIQKAIDYVEENSGSKINFIICSSGVKRAFMKCLSTYKRNLDVELLKGGYKALSYNGIPIISDRFCPEGTMYLLNTDDFALHQLCDWQWLEGEDGRVIKQVAGKAVYTATLVKYAELICSRPCGQAMLSGIIEA